MGGGKKHSREARSHLPSKGVLEKENFWGGGGAEVTIKKIHIQYPGIRVLKTVGGEKKELTEAFGKGNLEMLPQGK